MYSLLTLTERKHRLQIVRIITDRRSDTVVAQLDPDDNHPLYFPVDEGGWLPISDNIYQFAAVFDGNGHTIEGLATSRNLRYIGFIGYTTEGSHIRELGLVKNLAHYSGEAGPRVHVGGLVARQYHGAIVATYTTGPAISGTGGGGDDVGGLVGRQQYGVIAASYATGNVSAGVGLVHYVGGLLGWKEAKGLVLASFATGNVYGGDQPSMYEGGDYAGGLIGAMSNGDLIASYSTGMVNGGTGGNEYSGGLIGLQNGGRTRASYSTASVDGGPGDFDRVNSLIGGTAGGTSIWQAYGFGTIVGEDLSTGSAGSTRPAGVSKASDLSATNAHAIWNEATEKTLGAWNFDRRLPASLGGGPSLNFADYDGSSGKQFYCEGEAVPQLEFITPLKLPPIAIPNCGEPITVLR